MKNLKLFIATLLAATSMIACSKDKGGGGSSVCQAGYVQTDYNWIQQNGYNLPPNAYYQTAVNGQQNQGGYYYSGSQIYCVQQAYYNGGGNYYGGGNFCQYNPYAPGCYGGGGDYCYTNPYAPGCNGGGGGGNFCYYYPNHSNCRYGI
jgi:hypothetical protein